ncbi:hypothetical protein TWF706_003669 [Orbilia oligospora]|nr:hypothetical protein TWF706_003669 [Orbilia oligospora]
MLLQIVLVKNAKWLKYNRLRDKPETYKIRATKARESKCGIATGSISINSDDTLALLWKENTPAYTLSSKDIFQFTKGPPCAYTIFVEDKTPRQRPVTRTITVRQPDKTKGLAYIPYHFAKAKGRLYGSAKQNRYGAP